MEGHTPYGFYEKHMKRPLDFASALVALILSWPILLAVAVAVRCNMGNPVIFTQERPGLGGEIFKLKKFRTMTDEKHLAKFGKPLRSTRREERPELLNILKGICPSWVQDPC